MLSLNGLRGTRQQLAPLEKASLVVAVAAPPQAQPTAEPFDTTHNLVFGVVDGPRGTVVKMPRGKLRYNKKLRTMCVHRAGGATGKTLGPRAVASMLKAHTARVSRVSRA